MITNDLIKSLYPCKGRFNNYLKHYSNKSHTKRQFMGLKNITHGDKLWVAFRLMNKDSIRFAVADIAESVLRIFEEEYPKDSYAAAKNAYATYNVAVVYSASAAANVANAANAANAAADANDASNAAADAADAAYAAYYAAVAYAANADVNVTNAVAKIAANASVYASDIDNFIKIRSTQEKLIRTIILKYWK